MKDEQQCPIRHGPDTYECDLLGRSGLCGRQAEANGDRVVAELCVMTTPASRGSLRPPTMDLPPPLLRVGAGASRCGTASLVALLCILAACTDEDGHSTTAGNATACVPQCRPCKRGFPPTPTTNWFEIADRPEVVKRTPEGLWDRVCLTFRPRGNAPVKIKAHSLWSTSEYHVVEAPEVRTYECNEFDKWLRTCLQRVPGGKAHFAIPTIDVVGFTCASDTVALQVALDFLAASPGMPEDTGP